MVLYNLFMKNKSYDKKIFRLIHILNLLDSGKQISTQALAEEFNVSFRSIQRDIMLLSTAGFPLISIERGKHAFMQGFSLKKISVTAEERFLLNIFYKLFSNVGAPLNSVVKDFMNKVLLIPEQPSVDLGNKIPTRQREKLQKEVQDLSKSLEAKMEDLSYPSAYRKKIDEVLKEIEDKVAMYKKKRGRVIFVRTSIYEQPKPVATISVPKKFFKDPYINLDFSEHEKNRIFNISFSLPNKFFKTFQLVLSMEMTFKFWGPHLKVKKLTCYDDFASYLGFSNKEKAFSHNGSYGGSCGSNEEILITRATISWREDIPMPEEEIKPFLNKTGGLWVVADYSKK